MSDEKSILDYSSDDDKYEELLKKREAFSNPKVLVVDDSSITLKLIKKYLELLDYEVTACENAYLAQETIEKEESFDLAILDIMMPGINGYKLCSWIRERYSFLELPVLFLTSLKETDDIVKGFEVGANDYLSKPFNSEELKARSQTLVKLRQLSISNNSLRESIDLKNQLLDQLQNEINERRKVELELLKAKEEAINANNLKSQFLANISHEIRTPMNSIIGFSNILKERINDSKSHEFLNSIMSSGQSLMRLINDILDISKIEANKIILEDNTVYFRELMNSINTIFLLDIEEKNLNYTVNINESLPNSVLIDEARLRQILINLIGNAIKFTDEGSIEISLEGIYHSEEKDIIDLKISVKDTGIGIPKEQSELIFEAFMQHRDNRDKSYGGTGLGLAISKKIVDLMNGSLTVDSSPGEGSTFQVYIPDLKVISYSNEEINIDSEVTNSELETSDDHEELIIERANLSNDEINYIKTNYIPKLELLEKSLRLKKIREFAEELNNYSKNSSLTFLKDFSKQLKSSADSFDMNGIKSQLLTLQKHFYNIIDKK